MTDAQDNVEENPSDDEKTFEPAGLEDFYALIQRDRDKQLEKYRSYAGSDIYAKHLKTALAAFQEPSSLKIGDLVQWKTFLRNAEFPEYGSPAIVVEFTNEAGGDASETLASDDSADVLIGYLDGDQDLKLIPTDARRLMPWTSQASA